MRFEVPQFIEIEDKIFGPLTWRQFLYLSGGVGMAVVLFFTTNLLVFILIGLPLAVLAAALSFYPVNNRPFSFFLEAIFNYVIKQRLYLWKKKSDMVYKSSKKQAAGKQVKVTVATSGKNISSLARKLELQALQKTE